LILIGIRYFNKKNCSGGTINTALSKSIVSINPARMATTDPSGEAVPVLNKVCQLLTSLCNTCSAIDSTKYIGCQKLGTLIDVMEFASHLASDMAAAVSNNKSSGTLVQSNPSQSHQNSSEGEDTRFSSVELLSGTTSIGAKAVKKPRVKRTEPYKKSVKGNSDPKAVKEPTEKKKRGRPAAKNLPVLDLHSVSVADSVNNKRMADEGAVTTPPCIKKARVSAPASKWLEIDARMMTPVPGENDAVQQKSCQKTVNAAKGDILQQKNSQKTVNAANEGGSDNSSESSSDDSIHINANLKEYNRIKNSSLNEIFGPKKGCEVMRSDDEDDD
jgi:hypothetical protein